MTGRWKKTDKQMIGARKLKTEPVVKKVLLMLGGMVLMLGVAAGAQNASSSSMDEAVTAAVPWKEGEVRRDIKPVYGYERLDTGEWVENKYEVYRMFLGAGAAGGYLVQDFYRLDTGDAKMTDPFVLMAEADVYSDENLFGFWDVFSSDHTFCWGCPALSYRSISGPLVMWHPRGEKVLEGMFDDGRAQGLWMTWHSNGDKRSEAQFERGALHGELRLWNVDGVLRHGEQGQAEWIP